MTGLVQISFAPVLFSFLKKSFQNPNYFVSYFVYLSERR